MIKMETKEICEICGHKQDSSEEKSDGFLTEKPYRSDEPCRCVKNKRGGQTMAKKNSLSYTRSPTICCVPFKTALNQNIFVFFDEGSLWAQVTRQGVGLVVRQMRNPTQEYSKQIYFCPFCGEKIKIKKGEA